MNKDSRTKVFHYELRQHFTFLDIKERKYCRMANAVIPFSTRRCWNCPLWNGECRQVGCSYYDIDGAVELSSAEAKKRIDGMILAGITGEFPEFMGQEEIDKGGAIYERALQFAAEAHKGAYRKGSKIPFIVHPVEVAGIVGSMIIEKKGKLEKSDYEILASAVLHDVVEDTDYELCDIWERFNDRVEELVGYETEDKHRDIPEVESWETRKKEFLLHFQKVPVKAKLICMCDKLSNLRDLMEDYHEVGDECFLKFNNKNKKAQEWYYREIAKELSCFEGSKAYEEYCELLDGGFRN